MASALGKELDEAMDLPYIGESIRAAANIGSVTWKQLHPVRLQLLYEMAYLRMFVAWEIFLEESFLRYLCGYRTASGSVLLVNRPFRTIAAARSSVLGGHDFVSWSSPRRVRQRSQSFIRTGYHETVLAAAGARLEAFAAVRNRIAHGSDYAIQEFDLATMMLTGQRYRGSCAGLFLRDWNSRAVPAERWIQTIGTELKNLAFQIVP